MNSYDFVHLNISVKGVGGIFLRTWLKWSKMVQMLICQSKIMILNSFFQIKD